jgi:hypothetical protein
MGDLSIPGARLPDFDVRRLELAPGTEQPFDEAEWEDALVVVAQGEIELHCEAGGHRRFVARSILFMAGLSLRMFRSVGTEPLVLWAISRRDR